jgi:CelD/BcsL family acetyltransferase involved in cellulose biosynthesis
LNLEIIDSYSTLASLAAEWTHLPVATPFQMPDWQLAWWRNFGSGELRVILIREEQNLLALIPCFLHSWNNRHQLTLIGSGISDYLEPFIDTRNAPEVIARVSTYLDASKEWEICNWQDLSAASPLRGLRGDTFGIQVEEDTPCSGIDLPARFDSYWVARNYDLKRNVRRDQARAEAEGKLAFEVTDSADQSLLDALIRLHTERWRRHGEAGMIAANNSAHFLRQVSAQLAQRGMLRIFALRFDEQIAAVILGMRTGETIFGYLTGFEPSYERFGVGRILLFEAIQHSVQNGYKRWDFLRGEEPYKSWWGAERVDKIRIIATRIT